MSAIARLRKGYQLGLFAPKRPPMPTLPHERGAHVQQPGSRGGHYYRTDTGEVRYGDKPMAPKPATPKSADERSAELAANSARAAREAGGGLARVAEQMQREDRAEIAGAAVKVKLDFLGARYHWRLVNPEAYVMKREARAQKVARAVTADIPKILAMGVPLPDTIFVGPHPKGVPLARAFYGWSPKYGHMPEMGAVSKLTACLNYDKPPKHTAGWLSVHNHDRAYYLVHEVGHWQHQMSLIAAEPRDWHTRWNLWRLPVVPKQRGRRGGTVPDYTRVAFETLKGEEYTVGRFIGIARGVSLYATYSPIEFVAETYAAMAYGRTFDAEIMALYAALGGAKKPGEANDR